MIEVRKPANASPGWSGVDDIRNALPLRADMPPPQWCDRCQRTHVGMSREDYDAMMKANTQALVDDIDARIAADVYGQIAGDR